MGQTGGVTLGVPYFTTPTFQLNFSEQGLDLTQMVGVFVTFRAGAYIITKTGNDLNVGEKTITVELSQEETANFQTGNVEIQANWISANGKRVASEIVSYDLYGQLLTKVI